MKTAPAWTVLDVDSAKSTGGATLTKQTDGSILASGHEPVAGDVHADGEDETDRRDGHPPGALPDASLPAQGPGRAPNGNFVLNEFKVTVQAQGARASRQAVTLQNAQADFSQDDWAVAGAIDGNEATGWAISPQFGKPHTAVFEFKDPIAFANGAESDHHDDSEVHGQGTQPRQVPPVGDDGEDADPR